MVNQLESKSQAVYPMSWEEAVEWLRRQEDQRQLVEFCYYDDPLIASIQRFYESEEWQALKHFLPARTGAALDVGAGRGIASYALDRDGWAVTAMEPDASKLVGRGAIEQINKQAGSHIAIVQNSGNVFPFEAETFDLVYGRQVLHHAPELRAFVKECARVLKPGGAFVAVREPVLSKEGDLGEFLRAHPLQDKCGGEHAYVLSEYVKAVKDAGLRLRKVLGSYDSSINFFPITETQMEDLRLQALRRVLPTPIANFLYWNPGKLGLMARKLGNKLLTATDHTPGRNYSFIAVKP